MAILTPISAEQARTFLAEYSGDAGALSGSLARVVGIPTGTVNSSFALEFRDGTRRFLRVYEEQDRDGALAEGALLNHLEKSGVATPGPIPRADGGLIGALVGKPAALFPWREGHMRCLAGVSEDDARQVGRALAEVHLAGGGPSLRQGRFGPPELEQRLQRIGRCGEPSLAALAGPLRQTLAAVVAAQDPSLPRGLVHGDLFRDNVLWGENRTIQALLDFESACEGPFAFDLMVTILAWCFREALERGLARAMVEGYQRVRALTLAEARGLYAEGRFAALRFTITRITDDAIRAIELRVPPRRDKDWRRFAARHAALEVLGERGLREFLGLAE